MQEKLFIQRGHFSFFFRPKLPTPLFVQKEMTAVGLGQQGYQSVGSGFESLSCQIFQRFIPNIYRYPKIMKHYRLLLRKIRHCETKNSRRKIVIPAPSLIPNIFRYPNLM